MSKSKDNVIKPASALIRRNMQAKSERQNNVGKFTAWFLKTGKSNLVSLIECARFLHSIIPGLDITDRTVAGYVTHARRVLEQKKGMSIWNIKGKGWRIATENEKAIFLVKTTHRTLKNAERVQVLYGCTDRRLIPDALVQVFGSKEKAKQMLQGSSNTLKSICNSQRLLTNGR